MGEQVDAGIHLSRTAFEVHSGAAQAVTIAERSFSGGVAQLGEHLPCKQGVMSSNLTISRLAMRRTGPGKPDETSLLVIRRGFAGR